MASSELRRSKVISLVESGKVHSQTDLVTLLGKAGFLVTQATASRDLEEIGAMRGRGMDGVATYLLPKTQSFPTELILSVESSANMAVVRTPPGGAQLLASALDRESGTGSFELVIGTIAGDDTVLVISRKSDGGASLAKQLLTLAQLTYAKPRRAKK
ncbi:MAG: arginine repressor [Actinomycetes bacterium]